ncbi:AsmA-like C-terminal domain-containing protein [Sulfurovum sp.]|uniref:YhdP family protein n=1 Tax=Sulfurovum sp. TaxID=1969726 RepID=UPI0025E28324|nr:AsmA-like C-terminal domain-containing protein [Sulfurovum sp.]
MIKTSAMFSAHTIHVLHVVLRDTLIFLVILFVALFYWLKVGIHADDLTFGNYKIDGLYIKLDKKLTLKAENIIIPQSKADPSFRNVDKTFDTIKYLFTFFDYIELEKIHFKNNELKVIFADNILYITSDDYEIAGNIERKGQKLVADVSLLYIKKDDINIVGKLIYYLQKDKLETIGSFNAYHIKGDFAAKKEKNIVDFALKSDAFTDLRTLINKFPLKPAVKSWIVDKVKAKKYCLRTLAGKGEVGKDGFKMDFDALRGEVLFEDVQIHFKEKLAPVLAPSLILSYKNGGLYFDLKHPSYKTRSLEGSKVAITDLIGQKPTILTLDLHILSVIDEVVQEILKAYKLDIPVEQKGEKAKLDIKIDIPLKKSTKKTAVLLNVDLGEGEVSYDRIKLPVLKGNVKYVSREKETIVVKAALQKGLATIYNTKLPVTDGEIDYAKGTVNLKKVHIKESWYEGKVDGKVNIRTKNADLEFHAKQVTIGDKEKFFVLKNKILPLHLNYSKHVTVDVPSLKLKIITQPKEMLIQVGEIKKIKPYLKNIGLQIDGGKVDIRTSDFKTYTFKGELKRKACFFYDKENLCHTKVPCSGKVTKKGLDFYAFNKRLYFNTSQSRMKLKNLNIDLEKFLQSRDKLKKGKVKGKRKGKKLVIIGQNSHLRYDKYKLITDSYDVEVKPNGDIKAMGSLDGDIVKFSRQGKQFFIQALRVKDKLLHPLIHFKGLKKGRYSLKISGDPKKVMKGHIIVEGGTLSDFKAYNNTLAFINTLPALATLNSPGFSEKGFKIKEGVVDYRIIGDKVIFDSVYIKGRSATIVGKGQLNIRKKTIDMKLAIQTARELGSFVGNLPLIGYIIMGKDKSMTVGLKITGTLDKPKVQTSAAEDILTLPLQILKRTLESPAHIINK